MAARSAVVTLAAGAGAVGWAAKRTVPATTSAAPKTRIARRRPMQPPCSRFPRTRSKPLLKLARYDGYKHFDAGGSGAASSPKSHEETRARTRCSSRTVSTCKGRHAHETLAQTHTFHLALRHRGLHHRVRRGPRLA